MHFDPRQPRQRISIGLAGAHYTDLSTNVNAQTCVNWYPVISGPEGKAQLVLRPTAGTKYVSSMGSGPHRGSIEHKGSAYFVSGSELIQLDINENKTTMAGTLSTTSGTVYLASNGAFGNQVIIVDGTSGYTFNGTTLSAIVDADFPANPTSVDYMDGRAIVTVANSGVWYISDLDDFTSWTATQFANAERDRDNLVRAFVNNRDIMLFGTATTEVATNTGSSPFPFEVYPNGLIDKGLAAAASVAKSQDYVYWLSRDRSGSVQVVKGRGIGYQIVSNPALEAALSTYSVISDAQAFVYSDGGIPFYQITFPTQGVTWVMNLAMPDTNLAWTQRRTGSTRHIAATYVYFNGNQYVGAWNSSNLYKLSATSFNDVDYDGTTPIYTIRERTSHSIFSDARRRLRHYRLELEFEMGTGLVTGQGAAPQVAADWSDDGGHTWSNVRSVTIGGIGQYAGRAVIDGLGMPRNRTYRVRVSDPVKWVLIDAILDVEEMAH